MTSIRDATVADARAIAVAHVTSWQAGYRGVIANEVLDALSVTDREKSWQALLAGESSPARVLVVDTGDGLVAGFVGFLRRSRDDDAGRDVGEVAALYVDPGHWRRGVATALLAEALDRLAADGAREVTAWVLEGNEGGVAFWRAAGFAPDGATAAHEPYGRVRRFRRRLRR